MLIPNGLQCAANAFGKSLVFPLPSTSMPGKNFKLSGFGVSCVCMNMVRLIMCAGKVGAAPESSALPLSRSCVVVHVDAARVVDRNLIIEMN